MDILGRLTKNDWPFNMILEYFPKGTLVFGKNAENKLLSAIAIVPTEDFDYRQTIKSMLSKLLENSSSSSESYSRLEILLNYTVKFDPGKITFCWPDLKRYNLYADTDDIKEIKTKVARIETRVSFKVEFKIFFEGVLEPLEISGHYNYGPEEETLNDSCSLLSWMTPKGIVEELVGEEFILYYKENVLVKIRKNDKGIYPIV